MKIITYNNSYHDKLIEFLNQNNFNIDFSLHDKNGLILLLLNDENEISGVSETVDIGDETGEIKLLFIDKKYRNNGYGKLFIIKQELFYAHKYKEVILCNEEKNNTMSFVLHAGFKPYYYENDGKIWCKKTF